MTYLILTAIGLVAGLCGGMFGIGGGLIMVPALAYLAKFGLKQAIATSLAVQIPPVALLGAISYYRAGDINVRSAAIMAAAFFVANYFGAQLTLSMDRVWVQRVYALFLIVVAARMLLTNR